MRNKKKEVCYMKCPCCGFRVDAESFLKAAIDYPCPRCGVYKLSRFKTIYKEVTTDQTKQTPMHKPLGKVIKIERIDDCLEFTVRVSSDKECKGETK